MVLQGQSSYRLGSSESSLLNRCEGLDRVWRPYLRMWNTCTQPRVFDTEEIALDRSPITTLGKLFDRHFDDIYAYLAFRVAPDTDAARDLSQEVFAAALTSLGSLRDGNAARGWLLQIARNKVADHFRQRAKHNHLSLSTVLDTYERTTTGRADQEQVRARQERALLISTIMRQLPQKQIDMLEDKYIRDLSVESMATLHNTTPKAIESALSRARDAFRRMYASAQATEESAK